MRMLNVILMHALDVLPTVIALLFWTFQPQSNNAADSVVAPKTTMLFLTMMLKHKYAYIDLAWSPRAHYLNAP